MANDKIETHSNGHDPDKKEDIKAKLKAGDISHAFTIPHNSNVADQLVVPGEDPLGIAMRTILDKQSDGAILAVAIAAEWADLVEFEDLAGQKAFLMNLASRTSINGKAREQLVSAIIGDKEIKARRGFFDKVKDIAYGSNPDEK